jgi:predicted peptidase
MKYRSSTILWIFFFILFTISSKAQLTRKGYEQHHYKNTRYGLFTPSDIDNQKSYPLIVYLHGSRDTVSRDLSWYQDAVQKANPCFVLSPKCEEPNLGWGDTWHEGHTEAATETLRLVDSLIQHHPIDVSRLYI